MKGIVGKKLGMTQLFDAETGEVTPVTVIEAGPCPIVRVKTVDSLMRLDLPAGVDIEIKL